MKKVKAPVRIDFAGGTTDIEPVVKATGGAVLNAAINKYIYGEVRSYHLHYGWDIPSGAGLGTSGAMNLVWLALTSSCTDKKELAERVYEIEQAKGECGGKQDQYASALGGINLFVFNRDETVEIKPIILLDTTLQILESCLLLIYEGKPRLASDMNERMINNFLDGDKNVCGAMDNIKNIAYRMAELLMEGRLDSFGELFNEEWENRKRLHKSVTNPRLENLIETGLEYAIGAKVCGAAGGGCVLFYTHKKPELSQVMQMQGYDVIDFKFDMQGLRIEENC